MLDQHAVYIAASISLEIIFQKYEDRKYDTFIKFYRKHNIQCLFYSVQDRIWYTFSEQ